MNLAGIIVIVASVLVLIGLAACYRYNWKRYVQPIEMSEYRRGGC
jgi:hypothetical protein